MKKLKDLKYENDGVVDCENDGVNKLNVMRNAKNIYIITTKIT